MKKISYIITCIYTAFLLSCTIFAEEATRETASFQIAEILVSALYFIGVLALIYLILTLVSKWGKKHPDEKEGDSDNVADSEETAEESNTQKNERENTDE